MDAQAQAQEVDEILAAFLKATSEAESSVLLEQLVGGHVLPLIRQIVRSNLRGSQLLQDTEDVISEIVLQLLKRLRGLKANPNGPGLNGFRAYVAVAAYRACSEQLRQKYPERSRLKDKLRYILTHQRGLALWEGKSRQWLCGFASWREQHESACPAGRLREVRDNYEILSQGSRRYEQELRDYPAQLLAALFDWAEGPIELNDLIDTVAHLWQVTDQRPPTVDPDKRPAGDSEVSVVTKMGQRVYLEHLWVEICALPLQQRRALLMNARDSEGGDITSLLAHARIAAMSDLADALAMTAEEFALLWNELPLDDAAIANRLGLARQQVINLRSAARKRLSRRMNRFER